VPGVSPKDAGAIRAFFEAVAKLDEEPRPADPLEAEQLAGSAPAAETEDRFAERADGPDPVEPSEAG